MNWFKVHEDYDRIKEPSRFLIGMLFISPLWIGLAINEKYPFPAMIGIIFVCLITIHRIIYHMRYRR